MIYLFTLGKPL